PEGAVAVAQEHGQVAGVLVVGGGHVELAVAVEVGGHHGVGVGGPDGEGVGGRGRPGRPGAQALEEGDGGVGGAVVVGDDQVGGAVAVEVAGRHPALVALAGVGRLGVELARGGGARVEEDADGGGAVVGGGQVGVAVAVEVISRQEAR